MAAIPGRVPNIPWADRDLTAGNVYLTIGLMPLRVIEYVRADGSCHTLPGSTIFQLRRPRKSQ